MNYDRHLFIAIEGVDGVGKTTCAKMLAKKLTARYYKTPSGIFEKVRIKIDTLGDYQLRFFFYLTSLFYAASEIKELLSGQSVVCDRYVYSTIAYHKTLGIDLSYIDFGKLPLLLPDFAIYLWANEKTCIQRILGRDSYSSDESLEKNRELQQRIHQEFLNLPIIFIDTSSLSPKEVCEKILEVIIH